MGALCRNMGNIHSSRAARGALFALLLSALLLLSCCTSRGESPAAILARPLDAEMTVETPDLTYRVTLHLGAWREEGDAARRDGEIIFLSPDSLAGITLTEAENGISMTRDGMSVPLEADAAAGLLLPADLLSPASVLRTETGKEDGTSCLLLTLSDGRVLSVDPASGQILAIRLGEVCGRIAWIEERKGANE